MHLLLEVTAPFSVSASFYRNAAEYKCFKRHNDTFFLLSYSNNGLAVIHEFRRSAVLYSSFEEKQKDGYVSQQLSKLLSLLCGRLFFFPHRIQ